MRSFRRVTTVNKCERFKVTNQAHSKVGLSRILPRNEISSVHKNKKIVSDCLSFWLALKSFLASVRFLCVHHNKGRRLTVDDHCSWVQKIDQRHLKTDTVKILWKITGCQVIMNLTFKTYSILLINFVQKIDKFYYNSIGSSEVALKNNCYIIQSILLQKLILVMRKITKTIKLLAIHYSLSISLWNYFNVIVTIVIIILFLCGG